MVKPSATVSASSRIARPVRTSASEMVHGGTTCTRLKWVNGHRPRSRQAAAAEPVAKAPSGSTK